MLIALQSASETDSFFSVSYIFYLILFGFGLAVGSFLNVVIWRYKPELNIFSPKNLSGRSHCPYCGKTLSAIELVPVLSFLIQGGRCRSCRHRLSFQYPVVELLGGFIFAGLPIYLNYFYGINNAVFAALDAPRWYYGLVLVWILVFLTWLLIGFIDRKHYLIPNELNLALLLFGIVITALLFFKSDALTMFRDSFLKHYLLVFSPFQNILLNRILGALVGGLFFGALVFLSKGLGMGFGDVKMAFASGLVLGWPDLGFTMMISFVLGGAWGTYLIFTKKKTIHDKIPFAPFFVSGAAIVVLFGFQIIKSYFQLFNI